MKIDHSRVPSFDVRAYAGKKLLLAFPASECETCGFRNFAMSTNFHFDAVLLASGRSTRFASDRIQAKARIDGGPALPPVGDVSIIPASDAFASVAPAAKDQKQQNQPGSCLFSPAPCGLTSPGVSL